MRKRRIIELLNHEFNDRGEVIGVWIKTENPYREELRVLYLKKLKHSKDKYYYPVETPTIEIVHRSLPQVFKLIKRNAFDIDYSLRRRCFLLAWKVLWPDYLPPDIVKKKYYAVILEGYKKGKKPDVYVRKTVSENQAKKIISIDYNQEHDRPLNTFVLMRSGEVKNKKKGKQKPRTLFHEGGKRK